MIRHLKIFMMAVVAIYFSLIVFNNITDYETNHWCVRSVLAMEGVRAQGVLWRAIQTPWIVTSVYISIIITETAIALLCWLSVAQLLLKKQDGKFLGLVGLTLAFGLFMLVFVGFAGEWFYMWQHPSLAGLQQKAAVFSLVMLGCLIFISSKDQ